MSWCDKLASIPSIGVRMSEDFVTADEYLSSLSFLLRNVDGKDNPAFSLEKSDAFSVTIHTDSGFKVSGVLIPPTKQLSDFEYCDLRAAWACDDHRAYAHVQG